MSWEEITTLDPELEALRRKFAMPPVNAPAAAGQPPTLAPGAMPPAPMPRPNVPRVPYGPADLREPAMTPAAGSMPPAPMPIAASAPPPPKPEAAANAMPPAPLVNNQPPNRSQQFEDLLKQEPNRADFKAEPMPWWKKAIGLASSAAAGYGRKDDTTYNLASRVLDAPEAAAEDKYKQAAQTWKDKVAGVQTEAGLDEKGAQTREADARTKQIENAPPKEKDDQKVGEYTNDDGHVTFVFKKPGGGLYETSTQGTVKEKDATPKNTAEQLRAQIDAANAKGDTAAVKSLQKRLKDVDPMGENRLAVTVQNQENSKDAREDKITREDVKAHDKAYVQPAEAVEKSYQMMNNAYNDYKAAAAKGQKLPTGAESMLALSTHLATTFGNVKGARVTKDMIEHHLGARSISDSALVAVQKLTNGDVLSPDQWEAFHKLIGESRKLSWDTATKEAERKKIPVDFLPKDLQGSTAGGGGGIKIHRDASGHIIGVE